MDPGLLIAIVSGVTIPGVILYGLSFLTGWRRLADRYPALRIPPAPATRFGFGVFRGWLGYNGALVVGCDTEALYVRTWWIFAWCHPAFVIPWREVTSIEPEGRGATARLRVRTSGAPDVDFALRPQTFAHVRDYARVAGVDGDY